MDTIIKTIENFWDKISMHIKGGSLNWQDSAHNLETVICCPIISYRPLGKQMSKLKVSFVPVGRTAFAIRLPSEFHTHLPSLTSFDLSPLEALKVWTTSPSPSCSPPTLLERLSDFIIIRPYPNHIIFLLFSIFRIILNNTFG